VDHPGCKQQRDRDFFGVIECAILAGWQTTRFTVPLVGRLRIKQAEGPKC